MVAEGDGASRSVLDWRLLCINGHIFQQLLRLDTFHDRDGVSSRRVTLCEPFVVAANLGARSEGLPSDSDPDEVGFEWDSDLVRISKTLLSLHGVRTSLTEFLTHPGYAGDLYIPPDAYHTQFAEVCLDHCDPAVSNMCVEKFSTPSLSSKDIFMLRYIERKIGGLLLHTWNGSSIYSAHKRRQGYWRDSVIFDLVHGLPRVCQRGIRRRKLDR